MTASSGGKDAQEFEYYCRSLKTVVSRPVDKLTENVQAIVEDGMDLDADVMERQLEKRGMTCAVNLKHQAMTIAQGLHVVYGIVAAGGETYFGYTVNLERRLKQHNGELPGGARHTASGLQWSLVTAVAGFESKEEALRFEWQTQQFPRDGKSSILKIFKTCMLMKKWGHLSFCKK